MLRSTARTGIGVVLLSLVLVLGLLLPALVAPQSIKAEGPDFYALVQIPSGGEATLKAAVDSVPDSTGVYAIVGCTQAQLDDLVANGYTVIKQCNVSDAQCLPQLTATLRSLIGSQSTFQLQGGPDTFGYKFIDNNEQGGPCFNWIDITQTGTNTGLHEDDNGVIVPIGFTFNLYGSTAVNVGISTNGYLCLGGSLNDYSNDCIPNASDPNDIICPFWDDLYSNCAGADIFYQTFGSAPNRYLVVEWVNNQFCCQCDSTSLTFEAILYEGSNSILFQYLNMTSGTTYPTRANGNNATVGIENILGTVGLQYSCNSPTISNSLAILFYIPPLVPHFGCPTVATNDATAITLTSATLNGTLTSSGTAEVNVSFEYGTSPGVYPGGTTAQALTAAGPFSFNLTGLLPGTTYYFRAKGVELSQTIYGTEKSFITLATSKEKVSPSLPTLLKPAQISLQYLSVTPQQTSANQPVNISTNVVNAGDEGGNYSVVLKINGQAEESRMVSVGPQTTQPVKFTVTRSQPGTYTVDVGVQKGSFIIIGKDTTNSKPINVGLIAILVLGVLMIVTVVSMLAFRRPA